MKSSNRISQEYSVAMAENIVSELRQFLQDVIAPDLKSISMKVDGLQLQMEISQKATEAQLESFRSELSAFRGEQAAFCGEMNAFRAEMRAEF
jgi:hypothetical protein